MMSEEEQREQEARELLGHEDVETENWWGAESELSIDDLDGVADIFDSNMEIYSEQNNAFFNPHQATEDFARFFNALFKKFDKENRLTDLDFSVESHKDETNENGGSFGQIKLGGLEILNYSTGEDEMGVSFEVNKDNLKTALEAMLKQ